MTLKGIFRKIFPKKQQPITQEYTPIINADKLSLEDYLDIYKIKYNLSREYIVDSPEVDKTLDKVALVQFKTNKPPVIIGNIYKKTN